MGVKEHRDAAARGPFDVTIGVVSTSRQEGDDRSGTLIQLLLEGAGQRVGERVVIADDVEAIRTLVRRLQGRVHALILTGGTGPSRLDVTPEALAPLLDRPLPGFGELFRMLSFKDVGTAAMLSRATAGFAGPLLVFAVPGSPAAARLAVEELILPELAHLLGEAGKAEGALPRAETLPVHEPVRLVPPPPRPAAPLGPRAQAAVRAEAGSGRPPSPDDAAVPASGWTAVLEAFDGALDVHTAPATPPDVERLAPVVNVLAQGTRGQVVLAGRGPALVVGFPDLGPGAKVLLVATGPEGCGWPEIVALHRKPLAGTCVPGGLLPYTHELDRVAREVTGRAPPGGGRVLAYGGEGVWVEREGRVLRWDGSRMRDEGKISQALASLVLAWSRR